MELGPALLAGQKAGFAGIELTGLAEDGSVSLLLRDAGETKKAVDESGLVVCALGTAIRLHHADEGLWQRAKLSAERAVEMAVLLGAPVVRVFGQSVGRGEGRSPVISRIGVRLRVLARRAQEISGGKVTVAVQNGGASGSFVNAKEMWMITEVANDPKAGVVWDAGEAALVNESPALSVPTLNTRIHLVHVWDNKGQVRQAVPLGEGELKGQMLVTRLRGLGYGGWIVYAPPADPAETDVEKKLETAMGTLKKWSGLVEPKPAAAAPAAVVAAKPVAAAAAKPATPAAVAAVAAEKPAEKPDAPAAGTGPAPESKGA
jgi:sugar phosphate isomerase/epimerase